VGHDANQGLWHLDVDGAPPPQFAGIRSRLEEQQRRENAVDRAIDYLFEIPVSTAVSVAGFRYNHDMPELGERPFEVLVPHSTTSPWWQRLFMQRR
jgi:hypothetical protein